MNSELISYLIYIGVLAEESIKLLNIKKAQNKTEDNNNDRISLMKKILNDYLLSLKKEELSKIGNNIIEKYIRNKNVTINKHLLKVVNIINNYFLKKIRKCFFKIKLYSLKPKKNISVKTAKSRKNKLQLTNLYIYNHNHSQIDNKDFFERLNKFNIKKQKDQTICCSQNEKEMNYICTFAPDLSLTTKKNKKYNRSMENNPSRKKKIIIPNKKNITIQKSKKKFDQERVYKLYNDFQTNHLNKLRLKEDLDRENGITFHPNVKQNPLYNKQLVNNFYERNKKLLKDRKDFVDGFNFLRNLQMKGIDINKFPKEGI